MAVIDDLREQLIYRANINSGTSTSSGTDAFSRAQVTRWIEEAKSEHDPGLTWSEVAPGSGHFKGILLLAWINYCDAQATRSAERSIQRSLAGANYEENSDPWVKLAEQLRKRYVQLANALGIGLGGDEANSILVGEFHRLNPITEEIEPYDTQPAPPSLVLSGSASGSVVTLTWKEPRMEDFWRYRIFRDTTSGIKDLSTFTRQGFSGELGASASSTHVDDVYTIWHTTYKDPNNGDTLTAGTYYYLVIVEDRSGKQGYSNEVTVVVS